MRNFLIFFFIAFFGIGNPVLSIIKFEQDSIKQFPGEKNSWKGFVRYDFEFRGRACRIVCPEVPANGNPWIWNARFPDWHTDIDSILHPEDFHIYRGGLFRSAMKFEKERSGRVAFLGGSITYNPGWRDSVSRIIQKRFPETVFEFINAGIPSLGSLPDAFRIDQDVLSKGRIDLLFVEAAVNDRTNGYQGVAQIRSMEGIVRHTKASNPQVDIIFMYFVDPDKIKEYNTGITPAEIANHEKVAAYYNIPAVNLAKEVTARINNREFTWKGDFIDLHPSPFGQKIYSRSISKLLENCWKPDSISKRTLTEYPIPSKLDPFCYDKGKLIPVASKNKVKAWNFDNNWVPEDKIPTRDGYVKVPMLIGTKPGKILQIEFTGTAVGIAIASGPDAGIIDYSIDGKEWESLDLYSQWSGSLHLPWFLTLADDLEEGTHSLRLKLSSNKNLASKGTACRIRYFYVNRSDL